MIPDIVKKKTEILCTKPVDILYRLKIGPNSITTIGCLLGIAAGALLAFGHFLSGGLTIAVSGICDILDGARARRYQAVTKFGMFYDSVLDRYSELAVFTGLIIYYAAAQDMLFELFLADLALSGSLLVSYIRARAEGIDEQCSIGILQRPERIIILCAGTLLTGITGKQVFCTGSLALLAVFTNITALQRILHVRNSTRIGNP